MARALVSSLSLVSALLLLVSGASAHICLTYPMMRGPAPDLYPGDTVCYQRTGNCGELVKGNTTATFIAGKPSTITFQQNLNHFWKPTPGFFDLYVSYDDEKTWEPLGINVDDFPANNMNTQTYFNVPVIFPKTADSAVVRARYVSFNQNEVVPATNTDAIFYSCADVKVIAAGDWTRVGSDGLMRNKALAAAKERRAASNQAVRVPTNCQAPPRFVASGIETDLSSPIMIHNITYDTIIGAVKWVRSNVELGGTYSRTDYWNTTLLPAGYAVQYLTNVNGPGTCELYGADTFSPWSFGADVNMEFHGNRTSNGQTTMEFSSPSAGFTFSASVPETSAGLPESYCLPTGWTKGQNKVVLDSMAVKSIDSSVFTPPSVCTSKTLPTAGCWAHRIKDMKKRH